MNDPDVIARTISADIATLIVELVGKCEAAYAESDELSATVRDLREQRAILMQRVHELEKETKRQHQRIATLCDENRALRAQAAAWMKAAA